MPRNISGQLDTYRQALAQHVEANEFVRQGLSNITFAPYLVCNPWEVKTTIAEGGSAMNASSGKEIPVPPASESVSRGSLI